MDAFGWGQKLALIIGRNDHNLLVQGHGHFDGFILLQTSCVLINLACANPTPPVYNPIHQCSLTSMSKIID